MVFTFAYSLILYEYRQHYLRKMVTIPRNDRFSWENGLAV